MCIFVLDWYQFYLNHPGGSIITNTIYKVCYWKLLTMQADLSIKMCKKCQHFKNRKTLYGQLSPKIIAVLKLQNLAHIDPKGPYYKSIRHEQTGGAIIKKTVSLTCMKIIDTTTVWFELSKSLYLNLLR